MIGPSRCAGDGRDALSRVRRHMSRRSFLVPLGTRSCAIGAEALSYSASRFAPSREVQPWIARERVPRVPDMGLN